MDCRYRKNYSGKKKGSDGEESIREIGQWVLEKIIAWGKIIRRGSIGHCRTHAQKGRDDLRGLASTGGGGLPWAHP